MSPDAMLEPLQGEAPCGSDLFEALDPEFDAYVNDAEARLPARFFDADGKPIAAPSDYDPESEWAAVEKLMGRTRDLRVLAYYAQFCALARDLAALADCFDITAGLLEGYPEDVHPRIGEDAIDRTNALEMLDTSATMLMPLEFVPLVHDRRQREITFRRIALARGVRTPQGPETPEEAEPLMGALRAAENAEAAAASHAGLSRIRSAIGRIEAVCLSHETMPFRPNLEKLTARLEDLIGVLTEARPDLDATAVEAGSETADEAGADPDDAETEVETSVAAAVAGRVADMAQARAALDALETYFRHQEPSSPSFVLVRQARQLVGRPLVEALEVLVPEMSARARIDFGKDTGFLLTMERMRALSESDPPPEEPEPAGEMPDYTVHSRKAANELMNALEGYYAAHEPSSPIPILLTRARGYLNQSFTAILSELIPPPR